MLFWNNPKRVDNTAGELEGIFLGYYIQPGHDWKGEYLVAKLEAADYHVNWGALSIQRTPSEGFIFPLKTLMTRSRPKQIV